MKQRSRVPFGERVLSVLAVLLLSLLLPIPSASAHDVLTDTSPQDGQSLEVAPDAIELTFSNPPLAIGSEVLVQDAEGTDWATGDVQIVDNTARQPISAEAPAGEYTVTWRVVSSDAHAIEGTFAFTAEGPAAGVSPSTPPAEQPSPASPDTVVSSQPEAAAPQQVAPETTEQGVSVAFLIILAVLAGAFAGIVTVVLVLRRRTETTTDQ